MNKLRCLLVCAVLPTLGWSTLPVHAEPIRTQVTEDQLRAAALKLNELTTDLAMNERLSELAKNRDYSKQLVTVAVKMVKEAKDTKPFRYNASLVLGKLAQSHKEYAAAKDFFEFCEQNAAKLDSESKLALAMEALIELSWVQKDFDGVIMRCAKVFELEVSSKEMQGLQSFAVERFVQAKARKGDIEDALKLIDSFPYREWYANQLRSYVYREADQFEEVISALEATLKDVENEENLTEDQKTFLNRRTRYMIANTYVDLKKIDKAAEMLEGLMKDDPTNPTYPNDLGFVWCDNDMKIDESEKLIRKALDLDKEAREKLLAEEKIDAAEAKKQTSAYLDSLGWVLFKQKKYEEALKYLLLAAEDEEEAQHIEIWDHVADCYMALGKTQEAIDTWTKALKFEDVSKRDIERRKNVSSKLQKAKASLIKD